MVRPEALDALRERSGAAPDQCLATLVDSRLLDTDTRNTELMRIAHDPIAEHLAARVRTEALAGDAERWRVFLAELREQTSPGFLDAVRACLEHRVYGRRVPSQIRHHLLAADPRTECGNDGPRDLGRRLWGIGPGTPTAAPPAPQPARAGAGLR